MSIVRFYWFGSIRTNTWSRFIHAGRAASFKPAPYQPNSCSLIVHTGGTTGISKGVMISNDNANAGVHEAMHSPILMETGDVFLNIMPPFIAYGIVLGIHTPLSWGWKSVIIPKFDPASFGKLLVKHRPNGLIGVPSYFEGLFVNKKIAQMDLSFVKCVLAGGDKIPPDFEERINTFLREHYANIHLTKGYSLTEASAMATVSYENTVKIGSSGVPLVNTVISAFKEGTENELTYGKLGEICISSPTIMLGYCKNEEATKDMVWTHRDGNRWIHTGDLGYVDDDGFVFIEGRIKRMIIRYDGFKVFPPYIEKVVMAEPAVESCCAVAKPDVSHGQGNLPFVFCVLKPGVDKTQSQIKERLIALCRDKLPEYSQPIGFQFISELPVTPIGKVDYRALEAIAKEM